MSNYRVKYKKGDLEVEVESTEKGFVEDKVAELLISNKAAPKNPAVRKARRRTNDTSDASDSHQDSTGVDVPAIVAAINDSDEYAQIEDNILTKSAQLPRVIMCLYFAESVLDSPHLTSGNIELITDQLGIKIKSQNAGSTIKNNQKYFTADSVRKRGAIVKYKLNRKGQTAYKNLLKGEKLS